MSLESDALRVLLASFPGPVPPPEALALLGEGLGGVCLFGSNCADPAAYVAALRAVAPDAIVAIDEEGGDVTRLHAGDASPVLGPLALGAVDDLDLTRATGYAVGRELAALGISLDLGPVADVNTDPDNPVIGTRSFGTDPAAVAAHVAAWTRGLQAAGVAACVKHFPGHGDTAVDSHVGLPVLDRTLAELEARELVPFCAAVDAGVSAVMTAHVVVPALDPRPASLTDWAVSQLRDRLGFRGVVVTDALDMAGASAGRGVPETAVLTLAAGADLLCLGPQEPVRPVQAAIVAAVREGRLPEGRLTEAAKAVGALGPGRLTDRSVSVIGVLPDLRGATVVRVDSPGTVAVGDVAWGLPAEVVVAPGDTDLPFGPLVLQVRDAHRQPAVLATVAAAGPQTVVVEWGWPVAVGDRPTVLARGWSRPGAAAVEGILRAAGWDG